MDKLANLRKEIDSIDRDLSKLLDERFSIVKEIGKEKQDNHLNLTDSNRETKIKEEIISLDLKNKEEVLLTYQDIFKESKKAQAPLIIKKGALESLNDYFNLSKQVFIITDKGVPSKYLNVVKNELKDKEVAVFYLEDSEDAKSIDSLILAVSELKELKFNKSASFIGLGGGKVLDFCGFLAGVYMRGVEHYFIPTTILSATDACLGDKCALNFGDVKNLIGLYKPASGILIDPNTFATLSNDEVASGLAEVLKMALIKDKKLFDYLDQTPLEEFDYEYIISTCLKIKKEVVSFDYLDEGARHVLNFGHTIGHAIELKYNILHGIAVANGMLYTSSKEMHDKILQLMVKFGIPRYGINFEEVKDLLYLDKKTRDDYIEIVYLNDFENYVIKKIGIEELKQLFN